MFPAMIRESVSLRWSEEESVPVHLFYKHYAPTGRGTSVTRPGLTGAQLLARIVLHAEVVIIEGFEFTVGSQAIECNDVVLAPED
jgi:hypothetical protein